ncbi:hypothetical protein ACPPVO_07030 [Dactylosporangium sp. McL0621]|uniref:hypothetical protein n=1 Tax=Dactylosporangium sp. McL0621 TaxID=3415678 RepID=UPI003CEA70A0
MYMTDVLRALSRRWYVVVVGVVLTAALGYQAARVTPVYLASEVLVVKYPVSPDAPNPLTGLYPSVAVTAAAVATSLRTPAFEAEFRRAGVTGTYEFAPRNTGTNQEPRYIISSLTVTNTTDSEEGALRALRILTAAYTDKLKELQDRWNVRQDLRFTVSTLVAASVVELSHSSQRALIGSAFLGGLGTLAVPLWVDEIIRRRRGEAAVADQD